MRRAPFCEKPILLDRVGDGGIACRNRPRRRLPRANPPCAIATAGRPPRPPARHTRHGPPARPRLSLPWVEATLERRARPTLGEACDGGRMAGMIPFTGASFETGEVASRSLLPPALGSWVRATWARFARYNKAETFGSKWLVQECFGCWVFQFPFSCSCGRSVGCTRWMGGSVWRRMNGIFYLVGLIVVALLLVYALTLR